MAQLKLDIVADLSKLKNQIASAFKEKFDVSYGETTGGVGGRGEENKGQKKQNGILSGIFSRLAPLAVLLSLRPVVDLLGIISGFVGLFFLLFLKWGKNLLENIGKLSVWIWEKLKVGFTWVTEHLKKWVGLLKEKLGEWLSSAIEWIKSLPGRIWKWMKTLPSLIWEFLKIGYQWIVDKLIAGWGLIKDYLGDLKEKVVSKLVDGWTKIKTRFKELLLGLKERFEQLKKSFIEKLETLKKKLTEKLDLLKTWLSDLWTAITGLPGRIWNYMKDLASDIAEKIREFIPFTKDSVDDAIIKPDGSVIKTNPNDTIIATQNPGGIGGGGVIINFYGLTMPEAIEKVKQELGRTTRYGRF